MIFIDTGAFIALWVDHDGRHSAAEAALAALREERARLFTSNFVLDEAVTHVGRFAGAKFVAEQARNILDSKAITMLRPDEEDERSALVLYEKYADQRLSFTDAVSLALMRRHRIKRAFTFDAHFAYAGFSLWPRG